ncbi:heat shock transcription factor, Y-linked-like isoform X2 [Belonocnema kinseyi]|uniref:heat shock transcription factor, Y-linked-like isoform X2 n=1 Tax=Belonocnema kinseyi TaxID=2817044 RepID=UPI00143D6F4A|nr:heat shock transcription factor, Y-linked-like isoform X2 [Belonocnema kinseyi]
MMTDLVKIVTYDDSSIQTMKFPQKLWKIVNDCESGAILWSCNGRSILLEYTLFQDEYLTPKTSIFKTTNITSFIRQLNLYGFRKVTSHHRDPVCNSQNPDMHEFLHENFRSDRPDLLPKVCRKMNVKKEAQKEDPDSIFNHSDEFDFPRKGEEMTRLQMCQFALKRALEQALFQYKQQQKKIRQAKENEKCSADEENSTDTVLTFEIEALEESQEKSSSESETQESIENVIYEVPEYQFLVPVPVKTSARRFHPYFLNRNL